MKPSQRREVLRIVVRNRGRRAAKIESIGQATRSGAVIFSDLVGQVPFALPADDSKVLVIGAHGGYSHGDIRPRRFFAEDGAGRTHPLRSRWRLRLEKVAYRWVLAIYYRRQRRRLRDEQRQSS